MAQMDDERRDGGDDRRGVASPAGSSTVRREVFSLDPSRTRPLRRVAAGLGLIAILVPGAFLVTARYALPPGPPRLTMAIAALVVFLLLGLTAWLVYRLPRRIRLVFDGEGVTYQQLGYSVRARWSDVQRIGLVPSGMLFVEGLILRESTLRANRVTHGLVTIGRQDLAIPLTIFSFRWRDEELGAALRRHIPEMVDRAAG